MFIEHPEFEQPEDDSVRVWRYMDFTKFAALLEKRELFFCRLDLLGDPFEGSWPKPNVVHRKEMFRRVLSDAGLSTDELEERVVETDSGWARIARAMTVWTAVNCWHLGNHEPAAMWRMYLQSTDGVAIQSTYARLRDAVSESPTGVHLGLVRYLDFEREPIRSDNLYGAITCKRQSFAFESEVRAATVEMQVKKGQLDFDRPAWKHGFGFPVRLERLLEAVYVAPTAAAWFAELVKDVTKRYGLDFPVRHSSMVGEPLY